MDKKLMLETLINSYTDGNKARFAAKIGITPQLISNWLARNTFDAELLYAKCENISAGWLLSGEGEMLSDRRNVNEQSVSLDNKSKELLKLCKALVANYQQRDEVMNKLVSMVNNI